MIAYLRGKVLAVGQGSVIVDVSGVGYEVVLDRLTLSKIEGNGQEVELFIRTVVREDGISLYGFCDTLSRQVFDLLTTVTGVGPRLAAQILGGMPATALVQAVRDNDLRALTSLPGVGRKLAERIVLELSEKFRLLEIEERPKSDLLDDLRSALLNLGFAPKEVEVSIRSLEIKGGEGLEDLLRKAISFLQSRK